MWILMKLSLISIKGKFNVLVQISDLQNFIYIFVMFSREEKFDPGDNKSYVKRTFSYILLDT